MFFILKSNFFNVSRGTLFLLFSNIHESNVSRGTLPIFLFNIKSTMFHVKHSIYFLLFSLKNVVNKSEKYFFSIYS